MMTYKTSISQFPPSVWVLMRESVIAVAGINVKASVLSVSRGLIGTRLRRKEKAVSPRKFALPLR